MLLTILQSWQSNICAEVPFKKFASLMVCNLFEDHNSGNGVFLWIFQIFKEVLFCRTCPNRCLSEKNQKNVFTKSIHRETLVMASFLVQLQICGLTVFPKRDSITVIFYENWEVLQNINFTEQCCATGSDFLWNIQCITCLISDESIQS